MLKVKDIPSIIHEIWQNSTEGLRWTISAFLGMAMSPLMTFALQYAKDFTMLNASTIFAIFVLVLIDTLLGVLYAARKGKLASARFAQVLTKMLVYLCLIIAAWLVSHHTIDGERNTLLQWVNHAVIGAMFTRELLSILEKTSKLGVFTPPPALMKRLDIFDKSKKEDDE